MKKHLFKAIALATCAVLFLSGLGMITAAAIGRVQTKYYSGAGTGDINIKIDVYQMEDGKEVWRGGNDFTGLPEDGEGEEDPEQDRAPEEETDIPDDENGDEIDEAQPTEAVDKNAINFGKVLPGQTVSYITKITNLAEDAWIRVLPVYVSATYIDWLTDDALTIAGQGVNGNKGTWEKHEDGYYYYTVPVAKKETITFTTEFHVPAELTNDTIPTQGFYIYLNADAVQRVHFDPTQADEAGQAEGMVFGEDPWFGTPIIECYHIAESDGHYTDGSYNVGTGKDEHFSVEFEDFTEGFVRVPQDFFSNWTKLMPGDSEEGEVTVGNRFESPVTIFFHVETISDQDPLYDQQLLSAMRVEIISVDDEGNKLADIYSGPLYGVTTPVPLGEYEPGDITKLKYKLSFDTEYNNEYTLRDTKTVWVFSADMPFDLPDSGGMGVYAYFIIGGVFMVAGVLGLIIFLKRKGNPKDEG